LLDKAELLNWAQYWVAVKDASLTWETLYPSEPIPNKIPLPSYPFILERVWYQSKDPVIPSNNHNDLKHPSVAWKECWHDDTPIPSSILALGVVIDHLISDGSEQQIYLSDVFFGPPLMLRADHEIIHRKSSTNGKNIVQGLVIDSCERVLIQAHRNKQQKFVKNEVIPSIFNGKSIQGHVFYEELKQIGLNYSIKGRCVKSVDLSNGIHVLHMSLSQQAQNSNFWAILLSTILASLTHLLNKGDQINNLFLPYTLSDFWINVEVVSAIHKIEVQWDQETDLGSVRAFDLDNKLAIFIDGLGMRLAPILATEVIPTEVYV
jgi:hypothetical protein